MNIERIRQLADLIEKQPHTEVLADAGFNMEFWTHPCGTPSCIAGWAATMVPENERKFADEWDVAESHLELSRDVAGDLFMGAGRPARMGLSDITPRQAAAVLRNLADTGLVDWTVGAPESV